MPRDTDYDDDYQDDDDRDDRGDRSGDKPGWRRRLEKKAQRADDLARENAFLKAGVNPDDPKAKWLVKGYDGELTPEAIKAAASEAGILGGATEEPAKEEPKDDIPSEEKDAHERMSDTAEGQASGGERDFHAEMNAAKTPEELHRIAREAGVRFAAGTYTPSADEL